MNKERFIEQFCDKKNMESYLSAEAMYEYMQKEGFGLDIIDEEISFTLEKNGGTILFSHVINATIKNESFLDEGFVEFLKTSLKAMKSTAKSIGAHVGAKIRQTINSATLTKIMNTVIDDWKEIEFPKTLSKKGIEKQDIVGWTFRPKQDKGFYYKRLGEGKYKIWDETSSSVSFAGVPSINLIWIGTELCKRLEQEEVMVIDGNLGKTYFVNKKNIDIEKMSDETPDLF